MAEEHEHAALVEGVGAVGLGVLCDPICEPSVDAVAELLGHGGPPEVDRGDGVLELLGVASGGVEELHGLGDRLRVVVDRQRRRIENPPLSPLGKGGDLCRQVAAGGGGRKEAEAEKETLLIVASDSRWEAGGGTMIDERKRFRKNIASPFDGPVPVAVHGEDRAVAEFVEPVGAPLSIRRVVDHAAGDRVPGAIVELAGMVRQGSRVFDV